MLAEVESLEIWEVVSSVCLREHQCRTDGRWWDRAARHSQDTGTRVKNWRRRVVRSGRRWLVARDLCFAIDVK